MVSGEDYCCTDSTEASNITSLQSDSYTGNINAKELVCDSANRQDGNFQQINSKNCKWTLSKECKCHEIHSGIHHRGSLEQNTCGVAGIVEEPHKKDPQKDQCVIQQSPMPCLCHHKISAYTLPLKYKNESPERSHSKPFCCPFKWRKGSQRQRLDGKDKAFEVKLKQNKCPHHAEPYMCCEITEGIPNKKKRDPPSLTKVKTPKILEEKQTEVAEKIDIYYFDHGNSAYYRTTDSPPILVTEKCAEKTDQAATRFWAEIFGTIHIGTAFVTAFILQLIRFILYSIIRPLTVGILQLLADYFIKPLLSIVFNALIQPVLILLYNIATSFKDLCEPIAEAIGLFLREIANLCAAIRIVEVKQGATPTVACT